MRLLWTNVAKLSVKYTRPGQALVLLTKFESICHALCDFEMLGASDINQAILKFGAWISNHTHINALDVITHTLPYLMYFS